jgi:hypothetical protein
MTDLLDRIDDVTTPACAWCNDELGDSPSADFCGPKCQAAWTAHQHDVQRLVGYVEPTVVYEGFDQARWEPQVTVEVDGREWTIPTAAAAELLRLTRAQHERPPVPETAGYSRPGPVGVQVETTDEPLDDALLARALQDLRDARRALRVAQETRENAGNHRSPR